MVCSFSWIQVDCENEQKQTILGMKSGDRITMSTYTIYCHKHSETWFYYYWCSLSMASTLVPEKLLFWVFTPVRLFVTWGTDTKWHAVAGTLRCIFCSIQHSNTIKKALDSQKLVLIEQWLLTCVLNWLQWCYYTKHFRTSTHDAAAIKRTPGFMLSDAIHSV